VRERDSVRLRVMPMLDSFLTEFKIEGYPVTIVLLVRFKNDKRSLCGSDGYRKWRKEDSIGS
jgi:hypothetical protein